VECWVTCPTAIHGLKGKIRGVLDAFPLRSKFPEVKICGVQERVYRSKTILGTLNNPFLWANIVLDYVGLGVVGTAVHYGGSERVV
jgi:hypothetical protein